MAKQQTEQRRIELPGLSLHYRVLRQPRRRRRLVVRVSPHGQVEVRVPSATAQRHIDELLHRNAQWLKDCLAKAGEQDAPQYGRQDTFFYLGQPWQIQLETGRGERYCEDQRCLTMGVADRDPENVRRRLLAWLRARGETYFAERVARLCAALPWQQSEPPLRLRAMRGRWGSCSRQGICLNTRLMRAPPGCIDMVIVHELCHLKEMNHSPAFYALMDKAMPDWRVYSAQLDALAPQLLDD